MMRTSFYMKNDRGASLFSFAVALSGGVSTSNSIHSVRLYDDNMRIASGKSHTKEYIFVSFPKQLGGSSLTELPHNDIIVRGTCFVFADFLHDLIGFFLQSLISSHHKP